MEFELLIWIISFLVAVMFVILKKVRAAPKTSEKESAKRLPERKEKLKRFMSQVRQKAGEGDLLEDPGPIRKVTSSKRTAQAIERPPLPNIKPALAKADAESIEPAVSGKEILAKDLEFGIQDLRKAIIWSEILAPPLALRDK